MAEDSWNRVKIPFPSACARVRVSFDPRTDKIVRNLLQKNKQVLTLLRCEIFETEINVLHGILRVLQNSHRGMKTFKALKQVEQCITRMKNMNIEAAVQDLTDICPQKSQRELGIKAGQCEVPSQPSLEWTCLKVFGAAQLMSCSMERCRLAFLRSKQHLKLEEFVVLNVVLTSLTSRLWVIFRGLLVSLTAQYEKLLQLLKLVSHHKPMPYLTNVSLPETLNDFLSGSDALQVCKKTKKKSAVKSDAVGATEVQEDLGVSIQRDPRPDLRMTSLKKSPAQGICKESQKKRMEALLRATVSFCDMDDTLKTIVRLCKRQNMDVERRILNFLCLKCTRMKGLEASGHRTGRKLKTFKQEVCWALSQRGPMPKTLRVTRTRKRLQTSCQLIKSQSQLTTFRMQVKGQTFAASVPETNKCSEATETSDDDIDNIFASLGF